MRALELFAGIGGAAAALDGAAEIVAAVDISRPALDVYRGNFPHPTLVATLDSLDPARLAAWQADLWWLSPPCQPYTRRGHVRDDEDPRARALLHLVDAIDRVVPTAVALENVPGFCGSRSHTRLRRTLETHGYEIAERLLCPTELGWPVRRRRFYLVASREGLAPAPPAVATPRPLASFLDPDPAPDLTVPDDLVAAYRPALDVVDPDHPEATAACFTSAYGRSPVRSGSYIRANASLRRFSPGEILRLLGFPDHFSLPSDLPRALAWRLAGNSLAVPAVRTVLARLPGLQGPAPTPQ